jgi:hypothetical protein
MSKDGYDSYEDWYDNGPGSESFKREMMRSIAPVPLSIEKKIISKKPLSLEKKSMSKKVKNSKRALSEQIEALGNILHANVKLSPHIMINKGLLEEIVKNSRRILRYVEGLENDQDIS